MTHLDTSENESFRLEYLHHESALSFSNHLE
jgi:hypothetical protein